jgi:mono/diheme cytochrome c family protein
MKFRQLRTKERKMKKTNLLFLIAAVFILLFGLTACGGTEAPNVEASDTQSEEAHVDDGHADDGHHDDDSHHDDDGHEGMAHTHAKTPEEFASLENPFANDQKAIEAGKAIYETNCATCHGTEGMGDGPAAESLDPKPAMLADGAMMGDLSDGYLFWRVSKGGQMEPFNSAMPAWEAGLTEEQRWQVISYVRTLADDSMGMHMDDDHADEAHADDGH